jgi:uncharacterized protein (TIGR02118 family)
MSKAIVLMCKRADISAEDFRRHLMETHIPLLAKLPGLQRVVNNHVLASVDGSPPPYDLIGEAWFPSAEAMQAAYGGPEGQAVVADVPNFLDPAQIRILIVEEAEAGPSDSDEKG